MSYFNQYKEGFIDIIKKYATSIESLQENQLTPPLLLIAPPQPLFVKDHITRILSRYNSLDTGNIHGYQATLRSAIFLKMTTYFFQHHRHLVPESFQKTLFSLNENEIELFQIIALLRVSGRKKPDGTYIDVGRGADFAQDSAVLAIQYLCIHCQLPLARAQLLARAIVECEEPEERISTLLGWLLKFTTTAETLRDVCTKTIYMSYFPGWKTACAADQLLIEEWVTIHYRAIRDMNGFAWVTLSKGSEGDFDARAGLPRRHCLYEPEPSGLTIDVRHTNFREKFNARDPLACYSNIE